MSRKPIAQFPWPFRAAEKILLAAPVLVPLFFLPVQFPFAAPKALLVISLACVLLALLVSLWIVDRSYMPKLPKIAWAVLAYGAWLVFTGSIGANPSVAWWSTFSQGDGLIFFVAVIIFALALMTVLAKKDIRKKLAWALVIGSIGAIVTRYVGIAFALPLLSNAGTLGNQSFAAAYLYFPLFAALYLVTTAVGAKKMLPSLAALLIVTSPFFLRLSGAHDSLLSFIGESQAAAIALLISALAGTIFYLSYASKKAIHISAKILFLIFFLAAGASAYLFFMPDSSIQRAFIKAATPTRLLYGEIALQGIAERPLVGFGLNSYPVVYQRYFDPINLTETYLGEGWIDKPHNLLLEIGVNSGLPGLALYLLIYGYFLVSVSAFVRRGYLDRKTGALFFGLFLAYFLQNLFLFEVVSTQLFFWLTAAWFLSYKTVPVEQNTMPLVAGNGARNALLAATWMLALFGIYYFALQPAHEALALQRVRHGAVPDRAEHVARLFFISPMGYIRDEAAFMQNYAELYLKKLPDFDAKARTIVSAELASYLAIVDERIAKKPEDNFRITLVGAMVANDLAAYSANSETKEKYIARASAYATEAIAISPRNQQGYLERAKAYLMAGKPERAIETLELAISLAPGYADAHRVLLNVIHMTENQALYEEKLAEAKMAIPGFLSNKTK